MIQRRAINSEVDDEVKLFLNGNSHFQEQIAHALELVDPLTRQLVLFRAAGGDYRQACITFHISETTYYARLRHFRKMLITAIIPRPP